MTKLSKLNDSENKTELQAEFEKLWEQGAFNRKSKPNSQYEVTEIKRM